MTSHVSTASPTENGIKVRQATASDIFFLDSVVKEAYPAYDQLTTQQLLADLFESSPPWGGVLVAERGGAAQGAAAYRSGYWSWSGRTLVLTGLYVLPAARRKGFGRRLVLDLCRLALAENAQLDWTQPTDPTAVGFFAQFGAHKNATFDGHCTMRMSIDSITFAANGPSETEGASLNRNNDIYDKSPDAGHTVTARLARPDDMPAIIDMINELAVYQGHPEGPQLTVKDLQTDGYSCASPWFFAFVAERGGSAVGMAMGNRAWESTRRHYLQGLYVRPAARRCGVANLIVKEFCKFSLEQGVQHVDLNVANDNATALKLYRRLRAVDVPGADVPITCRLLRSQIKDIVLQS